MAAKRILVLDDEPNIGASLRLILEREGYSVTLARSIAEAKLAVERADLLLLDVRLPDGSGIDFLRAIARARVPGARHHDLRPRNHRRSRGSHPQRALSISWKSR